MSIEITPQIYKMLKKYNSLQRKKILNMAWDLCLDSKWMQSKAVIDVVREAVELYAVAEAIVDLEDEEEI
jgi:propanediol dehydratase small subunit